MTKVTLSCLIQITILAASPVSASAAQTCCAITAGQITYIGTGWNNEGLYIGIDMATNAPCTNKQSLFMPRDHPQYKETQAIALLALAQARPIEVSYKVDVRENSCWGDNVLLIAIGLRIKP
jgi:hypothetical protein